MPQVDRTQKPYTVPTVDPMVDFGVKTGEDKNQ